MHNEAQQLESRLIDIVGASTSTMELLRAARSLELTSWCIGAGAVRSLVWDHLHGYHERKLHDDVDLVYFDSTADQQRDADLARQIRRLLPGVNWEVSNQASIHEWFRTAHGQTVAPFHSLADGIASWPEYATCVGVALSADNIVEVIAPHGLRDLFELKLRHNPARASAAVFAERVRTKRFSERWPMLKILAD